MTETDGPLILPRVKRILISSEAVYDLADNAWRLKSPWSVRFLPAGKRFPYRETELWVYTQFVGGLGAVRLGVEVRQKNVAFRDQPAEAEFQVTYRHVGVQVEDNSFTFPPGDTRLTVYETAIHLGRVPFRQEGVFEFRVIALTADGHTALDGMVAEVTLLDPERGL